MMLLSLALFGGLSYQFIYLPRANQAQIDQRGVDGVGRIVSVRATDAEYQGHPVVGFTVAVESPDAFEISFECPTPVIDAPRFQPGTTHKVRYVQEDRSLIRFEDMSRW